MQNSVQTFAIDHTSRSKLVRQRANGYVLWLQPQKEQEIKGTNSLCALKDFNRTQKRPQQHPQYSKEAFWLNPFFSAQKPEKLLAAQLKSLELLFSQSKCRPSFCRMSILKPKNTMESKEKYKSWLQDLKISNPKTYIHLTNIQLSKLV